MSADGYISNLEYLHGYFAETSPVRLRLALLSRGIRHRVGYEPSYLELGFGQGVSLVVNAATHSGEFFGTDFNPAQVANAQELARAAGVPVTLWADSFEDMEARTDLPQFDIIVLHGIWSWVSERNRQAIVNIARRRLRPGGIFYVSYNCLPGWSAAGPLRHLMVEYSRRVASGGLLERVEQSLAFVGKMIETQAGYFGAPPLRERFEFISRQDRHYLAHEYFNMEWMPMDFAQVATQLADAQLSYAASASILDNLPALSVPPQGLGLIGELSDPVMQQTLIDYLVNRQFRRDIFVKGHQVLDGHEHRQLAGQQGFCLLSSSEEPPEAMTTTAGRLNLKPEVYRPVMEALARGHRSGQSADEIAEACAARGVAFWQVFEALLVLTSAGVVAPGNELGAADDAMGRTARLNGYICDRADRFAGVEYLASPVTGTGHPLSYVQQMFLRAIVQGVPDVPRDTWAILAQNNRHLLRDGVELRTEEENLVELERLYESFRTDLLPQLQRIGIAHEAKVHA